MVGEHSGEGKDYYQDPAYAENDADQSNVGRAELASGDTSPLMSKTPVFRRHPLLTTARVQ